MLRELTLVSCIQALDIRSWGERTPDALSIFPICARSLTKLDAREAGSRRARSLRMAQGLLYSLSRERTARRSLALVPRGGTAGFRVRAWHGYCVPKLSQVSNNQASTRGENEMTAFTCRRPCRHAATAHMQTPSTRSNNLRLWEPCIPSARCTRSEVSGCCTSERNVRTHNLRRAAKKRKSLAVTLYLHHLPPFPVDVSSPHLVRCPRRRRRHCCRTRSFLPCRTRSTARTFLCISSSSCSIQSPVR